MLKCEIHKLLSINQYSFFGYNISYSLPIEDK
jgi:hypothetical protein